MRAIVFFGIILRTLPIFAQNPVVTQYAFPETEYRLSNFTVLAKGFILLPLGGGIYVPGQKTWYYPPAEKQFIYSASPCFQDTSLYLVADVMNESQLIKLSKNNQGQEETEQIATLPVGMYSVFPVNADKAYIWGYSNREFGIWYQSGNRRDTLFVSDKPISAIAPINEYAVYFAHQKAIFLLQKGQAIQKISAFDNVIDGLAVSSDGSLYVSTKQGILKISGKDRSELVVRDLHGYLQWKSNALYVLDQANNRVLQFQWK